MLLSSVSLFVAACTSQGLPSSFADQDGRAEKQFIASCESALDGEQEDGLCQCAFYTLAAELTFEEFLDLDEALKDEPTSLQNAEWNRERGLIEGVSLPCSFSAADVPS